MFKRFSIGFLVLAAFLVACGGDGDDAADAPSATGSPEAPAGGNGDTPPQTGSGSGTLEVDGKTFEYNVIFCGFTPEETRNANVSFSFRGTGEDDGRSYSVDGVILDVGNGPNHSLDIWYDDDPANVLYMSGGSGLSPEFVIDGKDVSLEGDFTSAGGPVGIGAMQATCP